MIWNIVLAVQILFGIFGFAAGKIFYADMEQGYLLTGFGAGLTIVGAIALIWRLWIKSRKLSDKDKRSVIGVIERKAELRRECAQKAGYYTFCLSLYIGAIGLIAIEVGGFNRVVMYTLGIFFAVQLLLFGTIYVVGRLRSDD